MSLFRKRISPPTKTYRASRISRQAALTSGRLPQPPFDFSRDRVAVTDCEQRRRVAEIEESAAGELQQDQVASLWHGDLDVGSNGHGLRALDDARFPFPFADDNVDVCAAREQHVHDSRKRILIVTAAPFDCSAGAFQLCPRIRVEDSQVGRQEVDIDSRSWIPTRCDGESTDEPVTCANRVEHAAYGINVHRRRRSPNGAVPDDAWP
jgi:hypothetical protein